MTGTAEESYDFDGRRAAAADLRHLRAARQAVFDRSDDLLNPTKGYRLKLNLSPETSVQGAVRPYARTMVEATGYFPFGRSFVLAGRARAGSIFGIDRNDLAPSRRYYGGGGGGSVRGYGFQRLGPIEPVSVLTPDESEHRPRRSPSGRRPQHQRILDRGPLSFRRFRDRALRRCGQRL
ncbi:BamA/TamA family outer membrane protein [Sphingomonas sp. MMS24-JH45]